MFKRYIHNNWRFMIAVAVAVAVGYALPDMSSLQGVLLGAAVGTAFALGEGQGRQQRYADQRLLNVYRQATESLTDVVEATYTVLATRPEVPRSEVASILAELLAGAGRTPERPDLHSVK